MNEAHVYFYCSQGFMVVVVFFVWSYRDSWGPHISSLIISESSFYRFLLKYIIINI